MSQQDASEAFTFITSTLALPLLTLKMDIFHTGKEDVGDDHKFINERLLELAIPDEPPDGHVITLEECLEMYFNNRIEVKRYLDQLERRNTMNSIRSRRSIDSTKANSSHVEVAEVNDSSQPTSPTAVQSQPSTPLSPVASARPALQRKRAPSIIQEHYVDEKKALLDRAVSIDEKSPQSGRRRKEVIMPAWQFFSLIPWYTNNVPSNDAQVAAHFSSTRPILGICLKRYSMLANGTAVKRTTRIDIPLEIGLPHFIQDDDMTEDGPAFGNFKLSLQSVVCHQGISTESGHYVSLVRSPDPDPDVEDRWMRFDDLAGERVTYTNVETFLLQESPYLVFYQVIPIESESSGRVSQEVDGDQPPAYSESDVSRDSKVDSGISGLSSSPRYSYTNGGLNSEAQRPSFEVRRPSTNVSSLDENNGERSSMTKDRPHGDKLPDVSTNVLDNARNDLQNSSERDLSQSDNSSGLASNSRPIGSRNRLGVRTDEKRLSASISRLAGRLSKDKFEKTTIPADPASVTESPRDSVNIPAMQNGYARDQPSLVAVTEKALAASDKSADRSKLKKEAKEKSKAAQRDHQHLTKGKRKEVKPDRECTVM